MAAALLMTACTGPRPDLARRYADDTRREGRPPVVVIPGLLGSPLQDSGTGCEVRPGSAWRLWPGEIRNPRPDVDYDRLMLEPGDGVVNEASLPACEALDPTVPRDDFVFFPMDFAFLLYESHDRLTGNINFQDNLLHALLSADELTR